MYCLRKVASVLPAIGDDEEEGTAEYEVRIRVWMCAACCAKYRCTCIREYGSTLYVGMTRGKNGGRIKRVQ